MTKVAVVFADGFEEIEALSPVDVFRRAGFDCSMLGLESASVTGSHGIQVAMDGVFDGNLDAYDLVVLPGGMPGSTNLRDHEGLITALQARNIVGKYIAAICAAPIVLNRAGLLEGRKFTCFPGVEEQIAAGEHQTDLVVVDGNIITSRGAGTALAFAYALVDLLGGDGQQLAHTMVYDRLFK
ncbi:DJ-1 family glyoxalase III [uncultured Streptococcus sp.]|uniref:DJ-1 family glyoxalase III n=1 Tax=uncultured Streptococcus sp. TaxID=83427 RepID=UPI0026653221|nr:DJ-1 family glyoxalase III [uncultured Streptococcus sp.]